MSEAAQAEAVDPLAGDEPTGSRSSYAALGDRVASVLERAQEVAEQIRAEAEEAAAHIQSGAKEGAEARAREVELELEQVRKDAEEYAQSLRQTAEAYASGLRRETEEAARKAMSEADAQARAIREAAEEMSRRIELAGQKRKAELQSDLGTLESRIERLLKGLTTMVGQTERMLMRDVDAELAGSLVDAIEVQRKTVA
jgi:cell division septum initiation protein DivIVA